MRNYLKTLRTENNVSQKDLADALGITQAYYSHIEAGSRQNTIDLLLLAKIADYFNAPVQRLVEQELALQEEKGA